MSTGETCAKRRDQRRRSLQYEYTVPETGKVIRSDMKHEDEWVTHVCGVTGECTSEVQYEENEKKFRETFGPLQRTLGLKLGCAVLFAEATRINKPEEVLN